MASRPVIIGLSLFGAVACVAGDERARHLRGTAGAYRPTARARRPMAVMDAWAKAGDGEYFGVSPSDVEHGLSKHTLEQLYGAAAMQRAQRWTHEKRVLYCGNASAPDAE